MLQQDATLCCSKIQHYVAARRNIMSQQDATLCCSKTQLYVAARRNNMLQQDATLFDVGKPHCLLQLDAPTFCCRSFAAARRCGQHAVATSRRFVAAHHRSAAHRARALRTHHCAINLTHTLMPARSQRKLSAALHTHNAKCVFTTFPR
jgi:hypothetical protein